MKRFLLFPTFILCVLMSFSVYSQYKPDERRVFTWDDSGSSWEHDLTMQFTYGNEGDKETNLLLLAMPGSENQIQYNKQYNAGNFIILEIAQIWNPLSMAWENSSKTDYAYDGSNHVITQTTQLFNLATMTYINSNRTLFTYTGANLTTETTQSWNAMTSTWINSTRDLYEYAGSDLTLQTTQQWNIGASNWVNDEQTEITYASAGKPSQAVFKEWNTGTNMWDFDERVSYTYILDLISEAVGEDFVGGAWVLDHRTLFTYVNALATVILYQERSGTAWVNIDRTLNTYDANGNNTISVFENYDTVSSTWIPESKFETDFSLVLPFVLSTESFNKEKFVVYPNPAYDMINVASFQPIEKMELFDVLGKEVKHVSNNNSIDVSDLKRGVYFIRVLTGNGQGTKKIAIE